MPSHGSVITLCDGREGLVIGGWQSMCESESSRGCGCAWECDGREDLVMGGWQSMCESKSSRGCGCAWEEFVGCMVGFYMHGRKALPLLTCVGVDGTPPPVHLCGGTWHHLLLLTCVGVHGTPSLALVGHYSEDCSR